MRTIFASLLLAAMSLSLAVPAFAAENPAQRPGLADGASVEGRKKIVFLSGHPSHGYAQHEGFAGCMLLAKCLNENVPQVYCEVYKHEWPTDPKAFDGAAAVIIYCDGGGGHMAIKHLKQLGDLMDKGVGLGCIHYAVEVPKGEVGDDFLKWIGGYFETFHSINPDWTADYKDIPKHDVTRGVQPFTTTDEWYYHMRFRPEMKDVTEILHAIPPDRTRGGKDGAYSGNPEIRAGLGKNVQETTVWVSTRENDGRGFGCTGGHFHFNWGSDNFRKTILNSIIWIAHVPVPENGVASKPLTPDDLLANLDPKKLDEKMKDNLPERLKEMNPGPKTAAGESK